MHDCSKRLAILHAKIHLLGISIRCYPIKLSTDTLATVHNRPSNVLCKAEEDGTSPFVIVSDAGGDGGIGLLSFAGDAS